MFKCMQCGERAKYLLQHHAFAPRCTSCYLVGLVIIAVTEWLVRMAGLASRP